MTAPFSRVGRLAEQLHGIPVGVGARERDPDAHLLAGQHPGDHGLGHGRVVGVRVGLPHRDAHERGSSLAVGAERVVRGGEVARLVGREVAQDAAGGEEETAVVGELLRELRRQRQVEAVRMLVVAQHGDVDGLAGTHRDGVVGGDRRLHPRGRGHLDDRDHALRFRETVADPVVEGDGGIQGRVEADPHEPLLEHLGPNPGCRGQVHDAGHQQHAAGRVDVGSGHVDPGVAQRLHEHGLRDGDRLRVRIRRGGHVQPHDAGDGLHAIGHDVLQVVRAHLVAHELEGARLVARGDGHPGLRGNADEPQHARATPDVLERRDRHLLAGVGQLDERVRDERHLADRAHRDGDAADP